MITCLFLGSLLLVVGAVDITINSTVLCAEEYTVNIDGEFLLKSTGQSSAATCSFVFNAGAVGEGTCQPGLCYMFDTFARFEDGNVSLALEAGPNVATYTPESKITNGPICMANQANLNVRLSTAANYVYNATYPGYSFRLSVFHHCGEKGQTKNMKFDDVVDYAKGYEREEEKQANERREYLSGVLVSVGLACSFLLIIPIVKCFTSNSGNRGSNLSVAVRKEKPKSSI